MGCRWRHLKGTHDPRNCSISEVRKEEFGASIHIHYEDPEEVISHLPVEVFEEPSTRRNFVFVASKNSLWSDGSVNVGVLDQWVHGNASVYALRTWEQVLAKAKRELFRGMCERSVDWPRVFWKAYVADSAEPSASLTNLISDSLHGRMVMDAFEEEYLGGEFEEVPDDELKNLISETSFRKQNFLPSNEIRCGDLFKCSEGRLAEPASDCDCIPRWGKDEKHRRLLRGEKKDQLISHPA